MADVKLVYNTRDTLGEFFDDVWLNLMCDVIHDAKELAPLVSYPASL